MAGPSPIVFHRWFGYHAPALRRLTVAAALGLAAAAIAAPFVRWEVTVLVGWDGAALAYVLGVVIVAAGVNIVAGLVA